LTKNRLLKLSMDVMLLLLLAAADDDAADDAVDE
jgi:hypothetical protein